MARKIGFNDGTDVALNDELQSYSHVIQAAGGYATASFTMALDREGIEDWLINGVGRHVVVYDRDLSVIWEGFINDISVNIGDFSLRRGPMTEVANRAVVIYSDDTTNEQDTTPVANDLVSQAMYGIYSRVLSAGQLSAANALKARGTYLKENAWPAPNHDVSQSSGFSVTANCVGYSAMLSFPYTEVGAVWTVREKIINVLESEPNTIFSTNYGLIEENTLPVLRTEDQNQTGDSVMATLIGLGGSGDDNRRIWGIYRDRQLSYVVVPTVPEYEISLNNGLQHITSTSGDRIEPGNILPGKWMKINDLLSAQGVMADITRDMRAMFIETVTFTAPYALSLQGGKTSKLPQMLAKWMLRSN